MLHHLTNHVNHRGDLSVDLLHSTTRHSSVGSDRVVVEELPPDAPGVLLHEVEEVDVLHPHQSHGVGLVEVLDDTTKQLQEVEDLSKGVIGLKVDIFTEVRISRLQSLLGERSSLQYGHKRRKDFEEVEVVRLDRGDEDLQGVSEIFSGEVVAFSASASHLNLLKV